MRHAFVSSKAEFSDPTIVGSREWNDGHVEPVTTKTGVYAFTDSDGGGFFAWNDASDRVLTFPSTLSDSGWTVTIKNLSATNKLTLTPTAVTVDGRSSLDIPARTIAKIIFDGTNYRTGLTSASAVLPANYVMASDPSAANNMLRPRALAAADIPGVSQLSGYPGLGSLYFGSLIQGITRSTIHIENAGSGDVDLFTVPSGSRAFVVWSAFNTAASSTTFYQEVKINGVYYRITANATFTNGTVQATGYLGMILEAGQSFSMNMSQAGLNIFGTAFVFPNTERAKTAILTSLGSGDNTLYTCPAGKHATILLGNSQLLGSSNSAGIGVANASGGSLNYFLNIVSNGGTPVTANKATATTAIGNGAVNLFPFNNWTLAPGDFISVNASGPSAGIAWVTVEEN